MKTGQGWRGSHGGRAHHEGARFVTPSRDARRHMAAMAALVVLIAGMATSTALRAQERHARPLAADWIAMDPARLADHRGGMVLASGLQVAFGFERLAYVNGELVAALHVQVADLRHITAEEATQLARLSETQLVQIGTGNTMRADVAGLVIQNTLDGQQIRVQTSLDVSVGTLGMLQALRGGEAMRATVPAAVGGL